MKYLLTENQFDSVTQKLIDETLVEFEKYCTTCTTPDAETWPDWLGFDDCNSFELIEKIKVVGSQKKQANQGSKSFVIFDVVINIDFYYIRDYYDFSDFLISLAYRIKQKYKITFNFIENDLRNTNTNRQW